MCYRVFRLIEQFVENVELNGTAHYNIVKQNIELTAHTVTWVQHDSGLSFSPKVTEVSQLLSVSLLTNSKRSLKRLVLCCPSTIKCVTYESKYLIWNHYSVDF